LALGKEPVQNKFEERVAENITLFSGGFNGGNEALERTWRCAAAQGDERLGLLDQDLGGLDDRADGVADFQFHFLGAGASNDALDEVVANANGDMGHDVAELDFGDFADEAVASRNSHGGDNIAGPKMCREGSREPGYPGSGGIPWRIWRCARLGC
jgi:hypothetical protein